MRIFLVLVMFSCDCFCKIGPYRLFIHFKISIVFPGVVGKFDLRFCCRK